MRLSIAIAMCIMLSACGARYEYQPKSAGEIPATINRVSVAPDRLSGIPDDGASAAIGRVNAVKLEYLAGDTINLSPGRNRLSFDITESGATFFKSEVRGSPGVVFDAKQGEKYTFTLKHDYPAGIPILNKFVLIVADSKGNQVGVSHFQYQFHQR